MARLEVAMAFVKWKRLEITLSTSGFRPNSATYMKYRLELILCFLILVSSLVK